MLFTLLVHEWKSFWRARNAGTNLAIQIMAAFGMLYLLSIFVAAGIFLQDIIDQAFPDQGSVSVFCGLLLYYFAFDILVRFQVQELPVMLVQPYLAQNIRRKQLVNFLNVRSLFSLFNLLPFILLMPFICIRIGTQCGPLVAGAFIASVLFLTVSNQFLVMFVKRKTTISGWWLAGFFALILLFIAADYFSIFSLRKISAAAFTALTSYPVLCLVPLALAIAAFYNDRLFLLRNLYLDESTRSSGQKTASDYTWLNRFGTTGELLGIEFKLAFRNKRPRNALRSSFIFLLYGLFLLTRHNNGDFKPGEVLFFGTFITGTFIVQYGYLIYSAQCGFFDGLMTGNFTLPDYLKAKLAFFTIISSVVLLLSFFYGFINWKIIPVEIAGYFFNMGITAVLCLYLATYNNKAVDIEKSAAFNQKGAGFENFIFPLITAALGSIFYWPFAFFISPWAGILAVGLIGFTCLLLRDRWLKIIARQFSLKKYNLLEGFREK